MGIQSLATLDTDPPGRIREFAIAGGSPGPAPGRGKPEAWKNIGNSGRLVEFFSHRPTS